jgi:hypothetical protein
MKTLKMLFMGLVIFLLLGFSCVSEKRDTSDFPPPPDTERDTLSNLWKNDKRGCLGSRKNVLKKFHVLEYQFKKGRNFQELKQLLGEPDQKVYKNDGRTTINNYFIECGVDGYILHLIEEEQKLIAWYLVVT